MEYRDVQKIAKDTIRYMKGKIEPGCEVVVPSKAPHDGLSVAQWLGIGSSLAALGTMFATIVHLVK